MSHPDTISKTTSRAFAETAVPTTPEFEGALTFTADGYTDADGTEHVTAGVAQRAVDAAEKVARAGDTAPRIPHVERRHAAEMDGLSLRAMTVRSTALRKAIQHAQKLKDEAHILGRAHGAADEAASHLRSAGGDDYQRAIQHEREAEEAWQECRARMEEAALQVAAAPFADLKDVLARAEAYADLVGRSGEDALPDCDEDQIAMLSSYKDAILEMISRSPEREAWDGAVAAHRKAEREMSRANDECERLFGTKIKVDIKAENPDLANRLARFAADRDTARTTMLGIQPPDMDGLLALMDIVFDQAGHVDVGSYQVRAKFMDQGLLTEEGMWTDEDDAHRRALVLVASRAATLRDLEKPRDWRDAMRDLGNLHPNARDSVHRAYEARVALADLVHVQLSRAPDDQLPSLLFDADGVQHWVRPDAVLRGEMIK